MRGSFAALTAACVFLTGLGDASARDDEGKKVERTITVSGVGKVSAAPDVADINVGVVSQAKTAKDALAANTEAMTAIQQVLKERGVAAKDIQTTNISVQPQYSQPPRPRQGQNPESFVPKIVAYQVINTVQITARDLDKLGTVLDAVVQSGANQMNGISFRIDEPEKLLDGARKQAIANAKHKAELLAGESGVVVGMPVTIHESDGIPQPPRPMMGFARGEAMMAAAPVPVAAGEQELSVSVTVVYELQPAK